LDGRNRLGPQRITPWVASRPIREIWYTAKTCAVAVAVAIIFPSASVRFPPTLHPLIGGANARLFTSAKCPKADIGSVG
jgi:hypothetical protein